MKFIMGKPTVSILPEVLNKIKKYTRLCEHSVYWVGKVLRNGEDYFISDAQLIKQTVGKNGELDYESLSEFELITEEEGLEPLCLGRTKKSKSVAMTDKDFDFVALLTNGVGYMIYIQTNTKNELSLNLIDFDKGIIFDDIPLTVCDTEYYEDKEILEEIKDNIAEPYNKTNKYVLTPKEDVKPIEIHETDKGKQLEIVEKVENKKEEEVVLEPEPPYEPNDFVKENTDFKELVKKVGGKNDA